MRNRNLSRLLPAPMAFFRAFLLCASLARACANADAGAIDLSHGVVVTPATLTRQEQKAVEMLVSEVEKRSQIRWAITNAWPAVSTNNSDTNTTAIIAVGQGIGIGGLNHPFTAEFATEKPSTAPEGFRIRAKTGKGAPAVFVLGNDARGVLFGVGYILRQLRMEPGKIALASDNLSIDTAPKYPLRGHQLGYRPKTHSYDAWDLATWEQYFRDLAVFGANAIELMPPRSDDDASSPHFPLPPMRMMTGMSQLADDYGLDVWIWYPAMDQDYSDPATVAFALKEWGEVFRQLPRIDAVFVPGGDPGHTPPKHLMALLAKETEVLHKTHPKAQMWVSPQSFNKEWLDEFLQILEKEQPAWLSGVVFGPQVRVSLPELRAAVPKRYPIRNYPDITHNRQCQYPVPDWDVAYALTEARECINPRPMDEAAIFRLLEPNTIGFLSYSEGCNDDVNKAVWSALGWDPDQGVDTILREFSRYFIGDAHADSFAQGLLALERNWRGPLLANSGVETTLEQFQEMERAASPRVKANWRFQQALFRAYYDAYTRHRLIHETALENSATEKLRDAARLGSLAALRDAADILDKSDTELVAIHLRARIFELAEALFQSIRMQLSVSRYQAIAVDRGASLDTVDYPLNNRLWLKDQFAKIRALPHESARLKAIHDIVHWTDPGPGGFYDDAGNSARQPHLVRGLPFEQDPASLRSSKTGFEEGDVVDEPDEKPEGPMRVSWMDHAESLIDQPLQFKYTQLDPSAQYKVRVLYAGDSPKRTIRLVANDKFEIHPLILKPFPYKPLEFDIPVEATRSGELLLSWYREQGLGGNGRGCQVSEIWLIRK